MTTGTLEKLASRVGVALAGLEPLLAPDHALVFFEQLGTRFPDRLATDATIGPLLSAASSAAGGFAPLLDAFEAAEQSGEALDIIAAAVPLLAQVGTLLTALGNVIGAIQASASSWAPLTQSEVLAFADNFAINVVQDAAVRQLETTRPELAAGLVLLGVVDRFQAPMVGADPADRPGFTRRLHLERLGDVLSDPATYFQNLVGWGTSPLDPSSLLARLQALLSLLTADTMIDVSSGSPVLVTSLMAVRRNATIDNAIDLELTFPIPPGFSFSFPVGTGYVVELSTTGDLPVATITVTPPSSLTADTAASVRFQSKLTREPVSPETAIVILGVTGATRIEASSVAVSVGLQLDASGSGATGDVFARLELNGGKAVVDLSQGDGFVKSLVSGGRVESSFEAAATYSLSAGLSFEAGATLQVNIPLHVSFGGVELNGLQLSFPIGQPGRGGLPFDLATSINASFGPFAMVVDGVGLKLDIALGSGRLGIADVEVDLKRPTGIGVSIDGGSISGGGFIAFEETTGRYSGVLELRVFSVAVKAFGVLDTRFPDGTEGVSFVVVIVAEFTPIQLGFGFTLVGVGGLLGLNRSVNEQALGDAVRTGSLAHLLFPRNPVQDAPAIIHDLATVFPASRGHYIFGPMAKLGWGTPALITADLGIVIEFPGPRLAVLGVVRMLLPSPEFALVRFQLAVLGLLDFPARTFSLDASLFDSSVAGYVVTGDMAYRLGFGANAAFLLSVGGFNSGFQAPPAFPELRRASVDLGVSGNPSLVASGYFALTSNTAQIGAKIELRASGFGIRLDGHLGFDVLFVFSPFSFTASISAGVRISFHGVGFGITLRGSLSGPTPWHVKGRVCVSVLWWDACLPIDVKFGRAEPAALPEMDPWEGTPPVTPPEEVDPRIQVLGLRDAIFDPRNWSGSAPPAGFSVVSLAEAATAERTPIDPLGAATLRQKVVPLRRELEKFGEYKPITHTLFDSVIVAVNDVPEDNISFVEDKFAPSHFTEFSGAQRLSMPSYETMTAGFSIAPDRVTEGTVGSAKLEYETAFITAAGERFADAPGDAKFKLTHEQLLAQLERSASALGGIRRTGTQRFMLPLDRAKKVVLGAETFVVADSCSHVKHGATGTYTSRSQALLALRAHERNNPGDVNRFSVVPDFAVRAA